VRLWDHDPGCFPRPGSCRGLLWAGVRALCCYLLVHQHLPVDRAAQLLGEVLGAPLATGTVAAVLAEGAVGLEGFCQVVREQLAGAEQVDDGVLARLHARYQRLLADGQVANPPPRPRPGQRGRARRCPAANLLGRLDAHRAQVLRFLGDLRVPFDNNQAEVRHEVARCEWTRRWEGRVTSVA
jgi:hypothetical protein